MEEYLNNRLKFLEEKKSKILQTVEGELDNDSYSSARNILNGILVRIDEVNEALYHLFVTKLKEGKNG